MSKSSAQDHHFVPSVENHDAPEQPDSIGEADDNAWADEASAAYAEPSDGPHIIDLRKVTDANRTVSDEMIPGVNSFAVHAMEMFNGLDTDKSGGVSREELEAANSSGRYRGQDTQVLAGLMHRASWDRMVNFVNDKKDELTRKDLFSIGVKYNNGSYATDTQRQRDDIQAILTAFELAQAQYEADHP
jgi:hypothetical protein